MEKSLEYNFQKDKEGQKESLVRTRVSYSLLLLLEFLLNLLSSEWW